MKRIPVSEQNEFVIDLTERLMAMYKEQKYETEYFIKAKIIIIYAKK